MSTQPKTDPSDGLQAKLQAPFPWQQSQWQQLWQAHADRRLAHAYLLGGEQGLGKALFAWDFARAVLCDSPTEQGACGDCGSCRLGGKLYHPDILVAKVDEEEGATTIGIDQIRDLSEFLRRTSHGGKWKLALILEAHRMKTAAANSLLKTLEEPTPDTTLLLVSDLPGRLLPTVRSRCQKILFTAPDFATGLHWLESQLPQQPCRELLTLTAPSALESSSALEMPATQVSTSSEAPDTSASSEAPATSRPAAGMAPAALFKTRPLKALDLAASDGLTQWRQLASRLEELWQGRAAVEQVCKEAEKLGVEALLEYLLSVSFRLARTLLTSPPQAEAASLSELRALEQALQPVTATAQGRLTTARRLIRFRQHVEQAVMQIRSAANPNIQLMLESLLRRWQALPRI